MVSPTMKILSALSVSLILPYHARPFTCCTHQRHHRVMPFFSHPPDEQPPDDEPSLILGGEEMEAQMQQLRSKYPTSEADYLAAARARARAKPASREIAATQADFEKVAEEKKQQGLLDDADSDWEASAKEAGNTDSQILLPQLPDDDDDDGVGPEPTLLL